MKPLALILIFAFLNSGCSFDVQMITPASAMSIDLFPATDILGINL